MTETNEPNNLPTQSKGFQEKVRDRIRESIVDLIPNEEWERLVAAEIAAFTRERMEAPGSWNERRIPSTLGQLVQKHLLEEGAERIRAIFADPEARLRCGMSPYTDQIEREIGAQMVKRSGDLGTAVVQGLLYGMQNYQSANVMNMMSQLEQRLRNDIHLGRV